MDINVNDNIKTFDNSLRYESIDIAKFIGIFLVIYGHIICWCNVQLDNFIHLFHMPLFFIISGFLYKNRKIKESYKKIYFSIFIPYIIYQLIYYPFAVCLHFFANDIIFIKSLAKTFIGIITGDAQSSLYSFPCCTPCWFIYVILELRLFFSIIRLNKANLIIISTISVLVLKLLVINKMDLWFCLDITLMAIPYFLFGYWINNYITENTKAKIS